MLICKVSRYCLLAFHGTNVPARFVSVFIDNYDFFLTVWVRNTMSPESEFKGPKFPRSEVPTLRSSRNFKFSSSKVPTFQNFHVPSTSSSEVSAYLWSFGTWELGNGVLIVPGTWELRNVKTLALEVAGAWELQKFENSLSGIPMYPALLQTACWYNFLCKFFNNYLFKRKLYYIF